MTVDVYAPSTFNPDQLGEIPHFLDESDPRPAREQFNVNYQHGGGWRPMLGFTMTPEDFVLHFPGDPPLAPIALMQLRQETILVYDYSIVAIMQPDGSFEAARMD
jgi:hypothetical protein